MKTNEISNTANTVENNEINGVWYYLNIMHNERKH